MVILRYISVLLLTMLVIIPASTVRSEEKCTPAFKEVSNQSKCEIWFNCPERSSNVRWSGKCVSGKAEGAGLLRYVTKDGENTWKGTLRNGKVEGKGTTTYSSGAKLENEWHDGREKDGPYTLYMGDGTILRGNMKDGGLVDACFHEKDGSKHWAVWSNDQNKWEHINADKAARVSFTTDKRTDSNMVKGTVVSRGKQTSDIEITESADGNYPVRSIREVDNCLLRERE